MTNRLPALICIALCALLAACDDDPQSQADAGPGDGSMPTGCRALPLDAQPVVRFPVGHTHYLPIACDADVWSLTEGPADNQNAVHGAPDGSAFTPHVPGTYRFGLGSTGETYSFTAVAEQPFDHLNYFPTRSVAAVGDELWVAAVLRPEIVRVDPVDQAELGRVAVGPWPTAIAWQPGAPFAVVTHKAGDTLGLVDVDAGRIVESVYVGDEPSEVVLSPDGGTAYVSLPVSGRVAVVELASRAVSYIDAAPDVIALALSPDGSTLYAASYRSSVADRFPYGEDPRGDLYDVAVIDVAAGEVQTFIEAAGSAIYGLQVDGDRLYVATTRVDPRAFALEADMTAFAHVVAVYDRESLAEVAVADLTRQDSSTGPAVRVHNMAVHDGTVWVAVEGTDEAIALDAETLEEQARVAVPGRPRALVAHDGRIAVHGWQDNRLVLIDAATAEAAGEVTWDGDPRTEDEALGQRLFTGTGGGFGANHGCTDCHVDGLADGTVWLAGPFGYYAASRPLVWLEGTEPIGWEADAYDLESYLYGSPATTIGAAVDDTLLRAFYAYLAAIAPPPGPTDTTALDGTMSPAAVRGEAVFEGPARCTACHVLPLTTNRLRLEEGTEEEPTEVPMLIGSYRYGIWLLGGGARTLDEAVEGMLPMAGDPALTADQRADLVTYLGELSNRDMMVLDTAPRTGAAGIAPGEPMTVTFSRPVLKTPENLARITVEVGGAAVDATVRPIGRRQLEITPPAGAPGDTVQLTIAAGFEAWDERTLVSSLRVQYTFAAAPALRFDGDYAFTIHKPAVDFRTGQYDLENTRPITNPWVIEPTPWGGRAVADLGDDTTGVLTLVVDGDRLRTPPIVYREAGAGPSRTFPAVGDIYDEDGDGVIDRAGGELMFRAPGAEARGVTWEIARPAPDVPDPEPPCDGQTAGTHALTVERGARGPIVEWPAEAAALGLYVIEPEAMAPLGPGPVTGGEAWWVLQTADFPEGFGPRVVYGEVPEGATDGTAGSGGVEGGADLPEGECIKVHVTFTDFSMSVYRMVW